jgi:lipid-A-disaccharide synthase
MSLFLSCGEASGDQYAATLLRTLRVLGCDEPAWGMLGEKGAAEGGEARFSSGELGIFGIRDAVAALPRLLRLRSAIVDAIEAEKPSCVVVIDSPDFHLPLIASLRRRGNTVPVAYIAPPTVWAWRRGRVKALAARVDLCLPLFAFEHEFLLSHGVRSAWTGHPLVDEMGDYVPPEDLLRDVADESKGIPVAFLPGSRGSEIRRLLPLLLAAAEESRSWGARPMLSIAPGLPEVWKERIRTEARDIEVFEGDGRDLMAVCRAVVGASGTAAVEALLLGKFMTVVYRISWFSALLYRLLVRTPFVSLPNILAGEQIYPEHLQYRATSAAVGESLRGYITDPAFRSREDEAIARTKTLMGRTGGAMLWATSVMELCAGRAR